MATKKNYLTTAKAFLVNLWRRVINSKPYKGFLHYVPKRGTRVFGVKIFTIALGTIVLYILFTGLSAIAIYRGSSNLATRLAEKIAPYPAAFVGKHVISLSRYREEVAARQTYARIHELETSDADIASFVMNQLIDRTLYKDVLGRSNLKVNESDVDAKLDEIRDQVKGDDKLRQFLKDNYGSNTSLSTFRRWLTEAGYESLLQSSILERVTIKHILVALPASPTDAQKAAALAKINDIKSKITAADQFGAIARQYSEDIVSRDRDGDFGTTNRGDDTPVISTDFENAIFSLPVNTVSEPVISQYGWHLVLVTERTGNVQLSKKAFTAQLKDDAGVRILIPLK